MKATEKMLLDLFELEKPPSLVETLLAPTTPRPIKLQIVQQICESGDEAGLAALEKILDAAASGNSKDVYVQKSKELAGLLEQMTKGQLRVGTFDALVEDGKLGRRAMVVLPEGQIAFAVVPEEDMANRLRCGDTVWLDAQGHVLLFRRSERPQVGEEARIERRISEGEVEVSIGELGRFVYRTAQALRDQLDGGEAGPGSTVIVCQRRMFAFHALPEQDGLSHMRYLSREPVPDVVAERDLGSPPAFIERYGRDVRREMTEPGISERHRVRRSRLRLLRGAPGTGKTFSIHAFWNRMYRVMSEVTGVPVDQLPPRVLHLRSWEMASKWYGVTDKNIARFFEEVEALSRETFTGPDGREWELPLLVICEEIDALARQRGDEPIHDRIMATLLEHLDPSRGIFRDKQIFVFCTTNTPHLIDRAMVRRVGGQVDVFGHLDRAAFKAVLQKQLRDRPFRKNGAASEEEAREQVIGDLVAWLYAPNATDGAMVELTYVGQTNRVPKHRRDFITPALIDRAVQDAADQACDREWLGWEDAGLSAELVAAGIDRQVRSIVELLTPENCATYLSLPDGMRVGATRRIEQPAVLPFELERAS